ncbi:MAG: hypothetical protein ACE5HX_08835 [bacterium]
MLSQDRHSSKHRPTIWMLLLEVVLIIIGVLLGLAANQWRVARMDRTLAQDALRYIADEIRDNQTKVDSLIPYHTKVRDSIRELSALNLRKKVEISMTDLLKAMPKGFAVPLLETTGWQLANRTGAINHMDYELAVRLSKLYNLQEFYQRKLDKISDNLYIASNIDPNNFTPLTMALTLLANDIVIQENRLSKFYASILKRITFTSKGR